MILFQNDLLVLLDYFGYICQKDGTYAYQSPKSDHEHERRLYGVTEFQKFCKDVEKARNESFRDLEELIDVR